MNAYIERMLGIVRQSGEIALSLIHRSEPTFKKDHSIFTRADKEISELVRQNLQDFLKLPGHILIDEEDEYRAQYLDEARLAQAQYLWASDPIDGTRVYANGMPHFGISLGLLKDLRPWLGVVYFPYLRELFYCDGENSYFLLDPFTPEETKVQIHPVDQDISHQSIFLLADSFIRRFFWKSKECHILIPACAVADLCWPTIGRACGALFKSYLWDFAGSWPMVKAAGLDIRFLKTGELIDAIHSELFDQDRTPWKLKEYCIVSSGRNFPVLQASIQERSVHPQ